MDSSLSPQLTCRGETLCPSLLDPSSTGQTRATVPPLPGICSEPHFERAMQAEVLRSAPEFLSPFSGPTRSSTAPATSAARDPGHLCCHLPLYSGPSYKPESVWLHWHCTDLLCLVAQLLKKDYHWFPPDFRRVHFIPRIWGFALLSPAVARATRPLALTRSPKPQAAWELGMHSLGLDCLFPLSRRV